VLNPPVIAGLQQSLQFEAVFNGDEQRAVRGVGESRFDLVPDGGKIDFGEHAGVWAAPLL
jgi:hypothetical protein